MNEDGDNLGYGFGPAAGGDPDSLCVMVHGYGADGSDMMGAAMILADYLPGTLFVAPNGPEPCSTNPGFFQWYGMEAGVAGVDVGVRHVAPLLNRYIDGQLARLGLTDSDLVILGFSQGGGVALEAAYRRANPCMALLCYTSSLRNKDKLEDEISARPPTLFVHGAEDEVIPATSVERASKVLSSMGVHVETYICEGLGHTMNEEGVHMGAHFILEQRFA
ncbi:MAG: dienelactone hydrolase family protein [Gammaproteobacteria bacterium]|jgi:phospholipase/carboxylesterase